MKKTILTALAAAVSLTSLGVATPAAADPPRWAKAHGKRHKDNHERYERYERYHRYDDDDDYRYRRPVRVVRVYDDRGYYMQPRRITRSSQVWRGDNGRYYCRRDNGTTGLIIGAGVGALAGHELARDKTLGVLLGAAAGGLLGRTIDRGGLQCR